MNYQHAIYIIIYPYIGNDHALSKCHIYIYYIGRYTNHFQTPQLKRGEQLKTQSWSERMIFCSVAKTSQMIYPQSTSQLNLWADLFMVLFVSYCFYTTWRSWIVLDENMKPPKLHIGLRAKVGGCLKNKRWKTVIWLKSKKVKKKWRKSTRELGKT